MCSFQAQNDPRLKEAEIMSIPVIGGAGSWGNNAPGVEDNSMVSYDKSLFIRTSIKHPNSKLRKH